MDPCCEGRESKASTLPLTATCEPWKCAPTCSDTDDTCKTCINRCEKCRRQPVWVGKGTSQHYGVTGTSPGLQGMEFPYELLAGKSPDTLPIIKGVATALSCMAKPGCRSLLLRTLHTLAPSRVIVIAPEGTARLVTENCCQWSCSAMGPEDSTTHIQHCVIVS